MLVNYRINIVEFDKINETDIFKQMSVSLPKSASRKISSHHRKPFTLSKIKVAKGFLGIHTLIPQIHLLV